MLFSYIPLHPLTRDFRQRKTKFETVFDAIVVGRWSVFGFHFYFLLYAFICSHDPFPRLSQ